MSTAYKYKVEVGMEWNGRWGGLRLEAGAGSGGVA